MQHIYAPFKQSHHVYGLEWRLKQVKSELTLPDLFTIAFRS